MAATIGERWGTRRVFGKSLEGGLACLLACLVVGILLVNLAFDMSLPLILVGSVVTTVIELLPVPIDDNLTIPLFSGGAMTLIAML